MKIRVGNKILQSVSLCSGEFAWKIEDAIFVLQYLKTKQKVILGGDILNNKLEYTHDNWYYDTYGCQNHRVNIECSFDVSIEYLKNYIDKNGTSFYVVIVCS